jgi:chorismate synthase
MSGSTIGTLFQVTTFGESHGPYIGLVIDGVQPGLSVDTGQIQYELDRRRPGQSAITTSRNEADRAEIISGIFEGKTTGTPLCILIKNQDQRSGDYKALAEILRPGHASYTFLKKYGVFDYRGGGRASGRETACRVAKQFLQKRGMHITGYTRQIGTVTIDSVDTSVIETNPVRSPDMQAAERMVAAIEQAKADGDSLGGIIEIVVSGVPAGLGEPVFHKLHADLAGAMMSIGAVRAFEIGTGFGAATSTGSSNNDTYATDPATGDIHTRSNNAGGVLGGISNGEDIVMRIAVKPPSSISKPQQTVDIHGNTVKFSTGGRHDPCICPRVVPVAEAMAALVLIDHVLLQERIQRHGNDDEKQRQIETIDTQILLLLAQRQRLLGELPERDEEMHRTELEHAAETLGLPRDVVSKLLAR